MADSSNQHWIPKSYLKAWCDPAMKDKRVHRYEADGTYLDNRPPGKVFSQQHLYTIDNDGQRNLGVEHVFLKRIEDWFLKVRRQMERGRPVPHDYKQAMAWFVAAMRNRSPVARDQWQGFKDRLLDVSEQMARAFARATPEERKRMSNSLGSGNRTSLTLEEIREHAAEPFGLWLPGHIKMEAGILAQMALRFLKAPYGKSFITSDNPVSWSDIRGDRGPSLLGLGMPQVSVTMPISPQFCLQFHRTADIDELGTITEKAFDEINAITIANCDRFLVANSASLVVD